MNKDVIRISTEKVIETASAKSSSSGGNGRMRTTRIAIMPTASAMSLRRNMVPRSARRESATDAAPSCAAIASVMAVDRPCRRSRVAKLCAAADGPPASKRGAALASNVVPEGGGMRIPPPGKICRVYGYRGVNAGQVAARFAKNTNNLHLRGAYDETQHAFALDHPLDARPRLSRRAP